MSVKREQVSPTAVKLTISAEQKDLAEIKQKVLVRLGSSVKVPGFRPGHAPASLVERHANPSVLQSEFIDEAINYLYSAAIEQEQLRSVQPPQITLQKFVPFTTLEFVAELQVIGEVTLPDYTKVQLAKKPVTVSEEDIANVLRSIQQQAATKNEVQRAAQEGDELVIDFKGQDALSKEPIKGTDGKDYPLRIGSDTFIPGFEKELVGLRAGENKTFTLIFPADYGVTALRRRKVQFTVSVTKIFSVTEPKLTNDFAAKVGPFKTLAALRSDIRKQLTIEKQSEADQAYANELLEKIAEGTQVAIPEALIDDEVKQLEQQTRQNLSYRGQTWQEYLEEQQKSEAEFIASLRPTAEHRVKIGLIIAEVANRENLQVSFDELEQQVQQLKQRYKDEAMQKELDKPDNRRSISSRLLTEKVIALLSSYASSPSLKN